MTHTEKLSPFAVAKVVTKLSEGASVSKKVRKFPKKQY